MTTSTRNGTQEAKSCLRPHNDNKGCLTNLATAESLEPRREPDKPAPSVAVTDDV
jgi:hypothetical protein